MILLSQVCGNLMVSSQKCGRGVCNEFIATELVCISSQFKLAT